ncbi:MAG: tetratricopeptide repeat protein [Candidatus Omnitrophica bacterium]|nr:tetratricopeptide repeat protein [Candidatus Omnitrophota bacterium]
MGRLTMRCVLLFLVMCLGGTSVYAAKSPVTQRVYSNYLRGLFSAEEGDYRAALLELQKAKRLDPQSLHIRLKIASLFIRLGELDQAESELRAAKKFEGDGFDASLALIFLYSYAQRDRELEREYEDLLRRANTRKPSDIKISEYLAQFYYYKRNIPEAIKLYETIVKNNPQYVDGLFLLGYLYETSGRSTDAIVTWLKALTVSPEHAPTLNALAYAYAETGINLDEAKLFAVKAIAKEPRNGSYLDTLGWVYFQLKEYENARRELEQALSYLKDASVYEHLGDVHRELNNEAEAVRYYQEGLSRFPDDKNLRRKASIYGKKD